MLLKSSLEIKMKIDFMHALRKYVHEPTRDAFALIVTAFH